MSGSSWYNENFKYRWPVAVNVPTGSAGSHNKDVEIVIPPKWDLFWENILSSGYDIYCVDYNGNLLTQNRNGFNYANRTLTMRVQNLAVIDSGTFRHTFLVYIYFGNPSAANADTVFTPSSPLSGAIFLGKPTNMVAAATANTDGSETASASFSKTVQDQQYIWFKFDTRLSRRVSAYNDFLFYEGFKYVQAYVKHPTGPTLQAAMIDDNKTRLLPGWVGIFVQAGTDGQDYLTIADCYTTEEQRFSLRAVLSIRDQYPAAR